MASMLYASVVVPLCMAVRYEQEQVIITRVRTTLDTFVVSAYDTLTRPEVLRAHMRTIRAQQTTLGAFSIYTPHGAQEWRVFLAEQGAHEGSVSSEVSPVVPRAWAHPTQTHLSTTREQGVVYVTAARAITSPATGQVEGVATTMQELTPTERAHAQYLQIGYVLVGVVWLLGSVGLLWSVRRR
jgi:hypothetical protein